MSATKKLTGMGGDLQRLAALLQSKGRKGDTILAHINPREAALLKARGGAGTRNPATGLPEFFEPDFGYEPYIEPSSFVSDFGDGTNEGYSYETMVSPGYTEPPPTYFTVDPNQPAPSPVNYDLGTQAGIIGGGNQGQGSVTMDNVPPGFNFPSLAFGTGQGGQLFAIPSPQQQARNATRNIPAPSAQPSRTTTPSAQPPKTPSSSTPSSSLQQALRTVAPFIGAGASAAVARNAANRAQQQGQSIQQQIQGLTSPYKASAQAMMSGELTPANQQILDAARAQLAQGSASRGGVGAEQVASQVARLEQELMQNQYNMGLKVAQIADAMALRGIQAGLQSDQQVSQLLGDVMRTIARAMGGSSEILGTGNQQSGGGNQNTGTEDVFTEDTATTDGAVPDVG
jgi:hypothetical protein